MKGGGVGVLALEMESGAFQKPRKKSESQNDTLAASNTNSSVVHMHAQTTPNLQPLRFTVTRLPSGGEKTTLSSPHQLFQFIFLFLMTAAQPQSPNRKKRVKRHSNKNSTVGMTPDPRLHSKYK